VGSAKRPLKSLFSRQLRHDQIARTAAGAASGVAFPTGGQCTAWSLVVLLCTARPLFLVAEASGQSFSAPGCYQSRSTPASASHSNEQQIKPSVTAVGALHGASACIVLCMQCMLRRCCCRQYACQKLQSRHQGDGDGTEASARVLLTLAAPS